MNVKTQIQNGNQNQDLQSPIVEALSANGRRIKVDAQERLGHMLWLFGLMGTEWAP